MDCDKCTKYVLDEDGFRCPNCRADFDPFEWDVWFYFVYIIELDEEVARSRRFRERNPNMYENAKCFYVGQIAHKGSLMIIKYQTLIVYS